VGIGALTYTLLRPHRRALLFLKEFEAKERREERARERRGRRGRT
jgi:hypothetical protein